MAPVNEIIPCSCVGQPENQSLLVHHQQDAKDKGRGLPNGLPALFYALCVHGAGVGQDRPSGPAEGAAPLPLPLPVASVLAPTEFTRQVSGLSGSEQAFTSVRFGRSGGHK
jgi:hypothetical protein